VAEGGQEGGERLTRRHLIETGAAVAAAGVLARVPGAEAARRHRRKHKVHHRKADVVVVGAGFAGLTAAVNVARAGKSVLVLEARNRVGGRALNQPVAGGAITERGATFIGPTQNHIAKLSQDMGVSTFPTYDTGNNVYIRNGNRMTYSDTGPTGTAPPDPVILPELTLAVSELDQMSMQVPVGAPWNASSARSWDNQTLESWIKSHSVSEAFRSLVPVATRPIFGAEPRELSLLFTLFYIAASGDEQNAGTFERNFNTRGGAQESRFVGGSQLVALRMAQLLGRKRILFMHPVKRIDQSRNGVLISSKHLRVRAKRVIVAIPPTLAGRIDYLPSLPNDRVLFTRRTPQGTLIKAAAVYDRPFWRDAGLTGTVVTTDGYVNATFDDSPESGAPGIIFGFIGGDNARSFSRLSPSARRSAVLNQYVQFFGPQAANAIDYVESNWSAEKWTRGCPVAIPSLGTLTAFGPALRKPAGRIHWAGTETSTYWNGYLDGAVRSGERAATEVLAEI
jgi:monoamine oxidase